MNNNLATLWTYWQAQLWVRSKVYWHTLPPVSNSESQKTCNLKSLLVNCNYTEDCHSFSYFKGYAASLVGIGDSPIENFKRLLHLPASLAQPQIDKSWQIQDVKISNVPVRIYKQRQHDPGKKVTGVVYLHGGGWTIASVGKFSKLLPFMFVLTVDRPAALLNILKPTLCLMHKSIPTVPILPPSPSRPTPVFTDELVIKRRDNAVR